MTVLTGADGDDKSGAGVTNDSPRTVTTATSGKFRWFSTGGLRNRLSVKSNISSSGINLPFLG